MIWVIESGRIKQSTTHPGVRLAVSLTPVTFGVFRDSAYMIVMTTPTARKNTITIRRIMVKIVDG